MNMRVHLFFQVSGFFFPMDKYPELNRIVIGRSYSSFIFNFLKILFIGFRKKGRVGVRERETERERQRDRERFIVPLIYAFIGWFLYVPWLGIEPQQSWHIGRWHCNQLRYLTRAIFNFLWHLHTVFPSSYTSLHSHQKYTSIPTYLSSCTSSTWLQLFVFIFVSPVDSELSLDRGWVLISVTPISNKIFDASGCSVFFDVGNWLPKLCCYVLNLNPLSIWKSF